VIDLFSRRVVGWSMSATMTAELVTDALVMAIWRRGKPDALIHHSDRGSQGGFNRSSQHHEFGGCDEGSPTSFRPEHPQKATVAGTPAWVAA
jgi:putative transposase